VAKDAAARFVEDEIAQCAVLGDESRLLPQGFARAGATPPTITSPTSPSAWQVTT
jgi:hypothetical protein